MIKLVNKLNEWKLPLAVSGWPTEEQTVIRIRSLLRLAHFIQVPIRKPGVTSRLKSGTDVWKLGEKRSHSRHRQQTQTVRDRVEFGDLATGGKDHIQKHMYTQSEIPESSWARTITHCPPPPPPTQGRTSQRPKWVGQFRPRTTTRTPIPLLRIHLPPCFFLLLFSPAISPSLCLLLFVPPLFFKLVYRTRREAACGKELSLLSFDDVISVVVPQRTVFLWREKKASSFFIIFFLFSICLSIFLLFFVNDNKKDLPLNVQDVFSHTWTGF